MKAIIAAVFLCTVTAVGQIQIDGPVAEGFISAERPSTEQELAPYTILTVETVEDLESYLSEGYPTPEIQAILDDESIPEEDRYWLDCRMRSAIAQLLHRFYDERGNTIEVEADWIRPGEDYWQETMMVNPIGAPQDLLQDGPSFHFPVESGYLLNLHGQEIGRIAAANEFVRLSRDGSIGVVQTGQRSRLGGGEMFFCFMYPDGSFKEIEFTDPSVLSDRNMAISQDGSISAWNVYSHNDYSRSDILIYDRDGHELASYKITGMASWIAISPDNRYIAYSLSDSGSGIISRDTGDLIVFATGSCRQPFFSSNSIFCALPDCWLASVSSIANLSILGSIQISNQPSTLSEQRAFGDISISNNGKVIVIGGQCYYNGNSLFADQRFGSNSISPDGYFCFLGDAIRQYVIGIRESFSILKLSAIVSEVE